MVVFALIFSYDIKDDIKFTFVSQHDDMIVLFLMVFSIVIVPIYIFLDIMTLPSTKFSQITTWEPKVWKRLMFFPVEFMGLSGFVTSSEDSKDRLKMKLFLHTLLKKLSLTILKLYTVFASGQTVGVYSVFSLSKTYILFCKGVGQNVPFLIRQLNMEGRKLIFKREIQNKKILEINQGRNKVLYSLYSFFYVLGLVALMIPFMVFFKWDRSDELESYGFDLVPSPSQVLKFQVVVFIIIPSIVGGLLLLIRCIYNKLKNREQE